MITSRGGATSAPSTNDIHLRISFCLRRLINGITSHVTWSRILTQNDFYSLFRAKINNIRENRELGNMKCCFNTFKMLSYYRKLRYRWRNFMKFTYCIQMIQGNAISLCCDLKEKLSEKKFHSSSQTTGIHTLWLPVISLNKRRTQCKTHSRDTPSVRHTQETRSARHTQETHTVQTAIDQRGEQTIKKD